LADYSEHATEFEQSGVGVAALSVDTPAQSKALRQQLNLSFTFLCDQGREVIERWGLFNRAERGGIAYPGTFLIDRGRAVRYSSAETLTSRVSAAEMLRYLTKMASAPDPAAFAPRKSPVVIGPLSMMRAIGNSIRYGGRSPKS
jgi:peroxiredoxin